ncbi:hypothetical protein L6164_019368 [Bauhinia variegata]|uniref:Uncharacterized protein n=1 Tax=Bauhinia variegata TaxID=167791 RepID=A0ACB9MSU5_BAUVA|nr:hypothetical protein L6164_019368 [Bauhinia variegata]
MDKLQEEKENQVKTKSADNNMSSVWDCGSALYDSFELDSFKRQLDSAIANSSRTLSMPHLPERRLPLQQPQPPPPPLPSTRSKKSSKISRSLQKFLRSIFKPNNNKSTTSIPFFQVPEKSRDRFYVVYDKSGPVLSTIPEVPEFENVNAALSPEISSLVRRSASERFPSTAAIGISCA